MKARNRGDVKMTSEIGLISRFYAKYPIEQLMTMTEEEIMEKIDLYLDNYIKGFEERNPHKELPNLTKPINHARNKRTTASKKPIIVPGRKKK